MKEPKRIYEEKYKRMLELSEKVKAKRPAEGEIIHKLILHVQELYDYVDYLQGDSLGMDDDALERLGVPEANESPARGRNRNRNRPRRRAGRTIEPFRNSGAEDGWQAMPADLSWQEDFDDPPF